MASPDASQNLIPSLRGLHELRGINTEELADFLENPAMPPGVLDATATLLTGDKNGEINFDDPSHVLLVRYLAFLQNHEPATTPPANSVLTTIFLKTYNDRFNRGNSSKKYEHDIPTFAGLSTLIINYVTAVGILERMPAAPNQTTLQGRGARLRGGAGQQQPNDPFAADRVRQAGEVTRSETMLWSTLDELVAAANHYGIGIPVGVQAADPISDQFGFTNGVRDLERAVREAHKNADKPKDLVPDAGDPVLAEQVVYACIEEEMKRHGLKGKPLQNAAISAFSIFLVGNAGIDFSIDAHVDQSAPSLFASLRKATRRSITVIFEDWPILAGFSLETKPEQLAERFKDIKTEDIVQLLAYLRHRVVARANGDSVGVPTRDLEKLSGFVESIEALLALRLSTELKTETKDSPDAIYGAVHVTRTQVEEALGKAAHNYEHVTHHWHHFPKPKVAADGADHEHPPSKLQKAHLAIVGADVLTDVIGIAKWAFGGGKGKKDDGHGH